MYEKKQADFPGASFLRCSKLEPLPYIILRKFSKYITEGKYYACPLYERYLHDNTPLLLQFNNKAKIRIFARNFFIKALLFWLRIPQICCKWIQRISSQIMRIS